MVGLKNWYNQATTTIQMIMKVVPRLTSFFFWGFLVFGKFVVVAAAATDGVFFLNFSFILITNYMY